MTTEQKQIDHMAELRAASMEYVGVLRLQIEEIEKVQQVYDRNHGALELSIMLAGTPSLVRSVGWAVTMAGINYRDKVETLSYVLEHQLEHDNKQTGETK